MISFFSSGTTSVCNLYDDEEEVETASATISTPVVKSLMNRDKVEENTKTKHKMTMLRAKMDTTALKRVSIYSSKNIESYSAYTNYISSQF